MLGCSLITFKKNVHLGTRCCKICMPLDRKSSKVVFKQVMTTQIVPFSSKASWRGSFDTTSMGGNSRSRIFPNGKVLNSYSGTAGILFLEFQFPSRIAGKLFSNSRSHPKKREPNLFGFLRFRPKMQRSIPRTYICFTCLKVA